MKDAETACMEQKIITVNTVIFVPNAMQICLTASGVVAVPKVMPNYAKALRI